MVNGKKGGISIRRDREGKGEGKFKGAKKEWKYRVNEEWCPYVVPCLCLSSVPGTALACACRCCAQRRLPVACGKIYIKYGSALSRRGTRQSEELNSKIKN